MGARLRHPNSTKPKHIAAQTFEAMKLEPMLTRDEFLARAAQNFLVLRVAYKLLQQNPKDMAAGLVEAYGETEASDVLTLLNDGMDWLKGWQDILGAAQARAAIALCQRVTGMHDA